MKSKLYLIGIVLLFSLAFTSSQIDNLGTFKQGECINLLQICNCTYNNVTSVLNSSTLLLSGQYAMQKNGTVYNRTFCDTGGQGRYTVAGIGDLDGVDTPFSYVFDINPKGIEPTSTKSSSVSIAIWIMFIIAIIFFAGFMSMQNPSTKYTLLIVSMIFLVITINLVLVNLSNEMVDKNVISLFDTIAASSFYFYWFGAGMIFIIWVLTLFNTIYERFSKQRYDKFNGVDVK